MQTSTLCRALAALTLTLSLSTAQTARADEASPSAVSPGPSTGPDQGERVRPSVIPGTCEKPEYSARARRDELQGMVRIRFDVSRTGKVVGMLLVKSSGHSQLDAYTMAAMRTCEFKPGSVDGRPVGWSTVIDHVWRLE